MGRGVEPSPETARPRGPSLGTAISVATGFLALAGAIAYAIMRYSYQEFYNVFGLTPDDVGPSSAAALTQSGVGVATFVALFAVLPIALALLASIACERVVHGGRSPSGRRVAIGLALPTVAALAVYRAFTSVTSGHWEPKQLAVVGLGVFLLMARRSTERATPTGVLRAAGRLPGSRWIVAGLTTAVAALVLGGSLPGDAQRTALCAITHPTEPVRFVHTHRTLPFLAHIGVLRVRTDPAELAWLNRNVNASLPSRPLVYLGASGGRDFVFSVSECRTVQIPDGAVVLATIPNLQHCHYWKHPKVRTPPCT